MRGFLKRGKSAGEEGNCDEAVSFSLKQYSSDGDPEAMTDGHRTLKQIQQLLLVRIHTTDSLHASKTRKHCCSAITTEFWLDAFLIYRVPEKTVAIGKS